jgi:hypothetical protein
MKTETIFLDEVAECEEILKAMGIPYILFPPNNGKLILLIFFGDRRSETEKLKLKNEFYEKLLETRKQKIYLKQRLETTLLHLARSKKKMEELEKE